MSELPSMFRVAPPKKAPLPGVQLVRYVVDRVETPTPYLGLRARLVQLIFNPLSLFWIALALGVCVFGKCLVAVLSVTDMFDKQLCQAASGYNSVSYVADSTQIQALNSMRSSLWNIEHSSEAFVQSVAGALNASFMSSQLSATNTTEVLGQWVQEMLNRSKNETETMVSTLNNVEDAMESSGLYHINGSNISDIFDWSIPTNLSWYLQGTKNFDSMLNTGRINQNISNMIKEAREDLTDILLVGVRPSGNSTCTSKSYKEAIAKMKQPYIGAIVPFSTFAVTSIPVMGWLRYNQWQTALDTVRQLETHANEDTLEVAFQVSESSLMALSNWWSLWVRDGHRVYIKWVFAFAFSPSLLRILVVTAYLCILSIANAAILSRARPVDIPQNLTWEANVNSTFSSASQALNDKCQNVFSSLISNVTTTHKSLLNHANMLANTTLDLRGPLDAGVALEQLRLSGMVSNAPQKSNSELLNLMISLNNTFWLAAVALFCIWFAMVVGASVYAYFSAKHRHRITRISEKSGAVRY